MVHKYRSAALTIGTALGLAGAILSGFSNAASATPSACDAVAGNIVQNCGFETNSLVPWVSVSGNIVQSGAAYAHSGNYGLAYINNGSTSPLSQTLATVAGTTYDISFWLNSNGRFTNEASLSWGGTTIFNQVNIPAAGWTQYSFTKVAPSSSTVLQFDLRQDSGGSGLDDIVVRTNSAVPEPATLVLLGVGLAGLGLIRRRGMG